MAKKKKKMSDENIRHYAARIRKFHRLADIGECSFLENAINAGVFLKVLRRGKGHSSKANWSKIVQEHFPHIPEGRIKQYLLLGDLMRVEDALPFSTLRIGRLFRFLEAVKQAKYGYATDFLIGYGIEVPKDRNDFDQVEEFREQIDDLLEREPWKRKPKSAW